MKVGEIGLDKLTLTTQNFKVLDWGDKLWTPDSRDGEGKKQYEPKREDLLLIDRDGDACYHKRIFFNPTPDQKFGGSNVNITIGQKGLVMVWNPSKFERDPRTHIHPVNAHHVFMDRLKQTMDWVNGHLVDFDQQEMNIYRLDMCRNIRTEAPVSMYSKRLSGALDMSRCNTSSYPTGMASGNKSRRYILYDKVKEIVGHKDHKADNAFKSDMVKNWGENLMRAEIQMQKSDAVERYWKIHKLGHLENIGIHTLQETYRDHMKQKLFKVRTLDNTGSIPFTDGVNLVKDFKHQRDWFYKLLAVCSGLEGIEQIYGTMDTFYLCAKLAMGENPSTRMKIHRLKAEVDKLVKKQVELELNTDGISQMYDELYRKICA